MSLNIKVKLTNGADVGLAEIEGVQSVALGNVETGNLELYRTEKKDRAELPYFAVPWQKISDFNVEERGTFAKKMFIHVKVGEKKSVELESQERLAEKEVLADYIAFKKSAEEKFPKGASEKAVESLEKVAEAIGAAFGRGLNKAKAFGMGLKDKANKEMAERKKYEKSSK